MVHGSADPALAGGRRERGRNKGEREEEGSEGGIRERGGKKGAREREGREGGRRERGRKKGEREEEGREREKEVQKEFTAWSVELHSYSQFLTFHGLHEVFWALVDFKFTSE